MKLAAAKKRYDGKWIAFQFTGETSQEGKVLCADRDRHNLVKKLGKGKLPESLYLTYAGPILPNPDEYGVVLSFLLPCSK